MCDFEIPPMELSEVEPPEERRVEQQREEAPEAAVEQKAEQVAETAARESLDAATTEPRAFVEERGDYQQAEEIQRDFGAVADNLEPRPAERQEGEGAGSAEGSEESSPEESSPLPRAEGIRLPGTERGDRGEGTFLTEDPWPDEGAEKQEETAAPLGLDGGGQGTGSGGGEEEAGTGESVPIGLDVGRPGAAVEANAERVAAATPERPISTPAASAAERPRESDGRTDQVPEIPGEPEKLPDTLVDAIDEVMRRVGESPRTGSGDSSSGENQQPVTSTSTDSTSTSVDREGFVQGPGIPVVERFGMSRDQVVEDLMKYCKAQYDKQGGIPEGEDPQHWIADRFADYFESKFGSNPEIVKLSGMLRQAGDMKTGQPFGRTVVTRVPPSDSDFIGPPGEKSTPTPGTTTWGSKPGATTPGGTKPGGTTPAGTVPGSAEKGGMREGTTSPDIVIEPGTEGTSGQVGVEDVLTEPGGGQEEPGETPEPDDRGGLAPENRGGGGGGPMDIDIEEPSDDEIEVEGEFGGEDEGEGEGEGGGESPEPGGGSGGGSGGNGGSGTGGNGGSGTGGEGGSGAGGDGGGGDDGGGDDDGGDDDEGSTDSGDEGGDEEEGMTVDGGSGDEPGRRQGSILGGSVPSPGGETEDAGREGPILGGGALGGGGGEGSGSDVGGQEKQPISGGTQVYPDSGGARPIDPKRAVADVEAADQARQVKKTVAK